MLVSVVFELPFGPLSLRCDFRSFLILILSVNSGINLKRVFSTFHSESRNELIT